MTTLRASQIETLRAVQKNGGDITAVELSYSLEITEHSADRRLLRLAKVRVLDWRVMPVTTTRTFAYRVYDLTNKGRSELSGAENG